MLMKKWLRLCLVLLLPLNNLHAQALYYPPTGSAVWDTLSPASLGWCTGKIDSLYQYLNTTNTKGFLLLKDGRIVLEKYFGTFTQDSLWYWASAGKTLTAVTIGIAQQEGKLSIQDSTSKYLKSGWTSCAAGSESAIRIRHQLTMTTGFDDGVTDNKCTLPSCLQCIAAPGTRWAYHNAPYTLLQRVLDSATGNFNIYFNQKLRNPIGMNGVWIVSGTYDHVYYSTPRSAARFGLLMLGKGVWNGTPILTDTAYFGQMTRSSQAINPAYGYLWWLNGKVSFHLPGTQVSFPGTLMPHAPADVIAALGMNGQIINVAPSQGLVLVRMGNVANSGEVSAAYNDTIWVKLNAVMCGNHTAVPGMQDAPSLFSTYPQPARDVAHITLPGEMRGDFNVEILTMAGQRLLSVMNSTAVDVAALPPGLYLLRLWNAGGLWRSKILIAR